MPKAPPNLAVFTANAAHVADVLRALANERRLMILCKLVEWGEATVGSLVEAVGLSQSALSQHLAKMREEGIVTYRRESQTLWYRIADPRTETLLGHLQQLYCPPEAPAPKRKGKPTKERERS
jgi:ArsR family transcriptional regulator